MTPLLRTLSATALAALLAVRLHGRGIRVEFDPTDPDVGPFPTDFLTVPDSRQRTGLRVNLPFPDCGTNLSDCGEIRLINDLDGFSNNPRLTVKFSGAINPDTLREGIFYVWLDALLPQRFHLYPNGTTFPINQVVYDPATFTAHAKPDNVLEQSRRYMIIVTDAVLDAGGDPVEADPGFQSCIDRRIGGDYCQRVADGLAAVRAALGSRRVMGASIFTTLSSTAWLENARTATLQVPAQFRRTGANNVVQAAAIRSIRLRQHTGENRFVEQVLPIPPALLALFGVGRIAFGSIRSPRFLGPTLTIPEATTAQPIAPPAETDEVFFHVLLPGRPAPEGGYPVLIAGHGLGDSRWGMPTIMAAANAQGLAVVAMNAFGHGFGPLSSVQFLLGDGNTTEIPAPGRGVDANGNGSIEPFDGCIILAPGAPIGLRDCFRQTVMDYVQLLRAIQQGVDLDGDGRIDLSQSQINYIGQSLGSFYGSILTAVEPAVQAAIFNVGGGNVIDTLRLAPGFRLSFGPLLLGNRTPSLLNDGQTYDEQMPLRYQGVRLRTRAGASDLQDFFERAEWLEVAPPMVVAPHLKQATLPGVPVKRVLFQIALGDQTVPNPANSALIRAANMREQTSLYRHDLARAAVPSLPANPHTYLVPLGNEAAQAIALATIQQALLFLASGRELVPDPDPFIRPILGRSVFEVPEFLPEETNFLR
jgi:hypothetical protein